MQVLLKSRSKLLLCLSLLIHLASCGDPEPDTDSESNTGTNSTNTTVGVAATFDGEQLSSIANVNIYYDNLGRLSGFESLDMSGTIDYSKGILSVEYNDDYADDTFNMEITFNKQGYVSEIKGNDNYYEDDFSAIYLYKFSYNSDGCLSSIDCNISYDIGYDECNFTFTWRNGNLTRLKRTLQGYKDGEEYSENNTFMLSYGNEPNTFYQMTAGQLFAFTEIDGPFGILAATGLLGNGSEYLPTEFIEDTDTTYPISYILNSNGTVRTEQITYYGTTDKISYKYSQPNSRNSNIVSNPDRKSTNSNKRAPWKWLK